ncbi:MAG: hypothetical protein V9E87_17650 [Gemmatimonadales bacterium]
MFRFTAMMPTPRELFEIPEVRTFVSALDSVFPYWLYFMSRNFLGLQAIAFCLLPPMKMDKAGRKEWSDRLDDLIARRWAPANFHIAEYAQFNEKEADALFRDAMHYFIEGPRLPGEA